MAGLNFAVSLADAKTVSATKIADTRKTLVERMFTVFNKETGTVSPMGIKAVNCSFATAHAQGVDPKELSNNLPLYLNYKALDPKFEGETKGRDFIIVGKRPPFGKNAGSPGLMIDVKELGSFIEHLTALNEALNVAVPDIRAKIGLGGAAQIQAAQPSQAAAGPVRVSLDDADEDVPAGS